MLFFVCLVNRQADDKGGAFAELAGGGDGAGVAVGDAPADGEADAGAFVFATAVEALEHGEDFVGVFGVKADAVVLDGKFDDLGGGQWVGGTVVPATVGGAEWWVDELGGDFYFGGTGVCSGAVAGLEFEGVGDDILQELAHLHGVGVDGGEVANVDFCAGLLDAQFEVAQYFACDGTEVNGDEGLCGADDAGEGEEVVDECLHAGGRVLHALKVVARTCDSSS